MGGYSLFLKINSDTVLYRRPMKLREITYNSAYDVTLPVNNNTVTVLGSNISPSLTTTVSTNAVIDSDGKITGNIGYRYHCNAADNSVRGEYGYDVINATGKKIAAVVDISHDGSFKIHETTSVKNYGDGIFVPFPEKIDFSGYGFAHVGGVPDTLYFAIIRPYGVVLTHYSVSIMMARGGTTTAPNYVAHDFNKIIEIIA